MPWRVVVVWSINTCVALHRPQTLAGVPRRLPLLHQPLSTPYTGQQLAPPRGSLASSRSHLATRRWPPSSDGHSLEAPLRRLAARTCRQRPLVLVSPHLALTEGFMCRSSVPRILQAAVRSQRALAQLLAGLTRKAPKLRSLDLSRRKPLPTRTSASPVDV